MIDFIHLKCSTVNELFSKILIFIQLELCLSKIKKRQQIACFQAIHNEMHLNITSIYSFIW